MGRKKSKARRPALRVITGADRKPKTALQRAAEERTAASKAAWAERHPGRAAEERALRKANIATRARWAHKRNGTPETHEHASHVRQGALARLYQSGAIDAELLCAGTEIGDAAQLVMRDVDIRTASLETRVDSSPRGGFFFETLGRVRIEAAYSRWRRQVGPAGPLTLTIVLDDIGIAAAAALHHMSARRARQLLVQALELWQSVYADARRDIDPAALADAQAPIL